jgi:hypothetical protein
MEDRREVPDDGLEGGGSALAEEIGGLQKLTVWISDESVRSEAR